MPKPVTPYSTYHDGVSQDFLLKAIKQFYIAMHIYINSNTLSIIQNTFLPIFSTYSDWFTCIVAVRIAKTTTQARCTN